MGVMERISRRELFRVQRTAVEHSARAATVAADLSAEATNRAGEAVNLATVALGQARTTQDALTTFVSMAFLARLRWLITGRPAPSP